MAANLSSDTHFTTTSASVRPKLGSPTQSTTSFNAFVRRTPPKPSTGIALSRTDAVRKFLKPISRSRSTAGSPELKSSKASPKPGPFSSKTAVRKTAHSSLRTNYATKATLPGKDEGTAKEDKENFSVNRVAKEKNSKPLRGDVLKADLISRKTTATGFERLLADSTSDNHRDHSPSSRPQLSRFVAETDYSAEPRRVPNIHNHKSRKQHKEIHDLYFIGWGSEYHKFKK